MVIFNKLPTYYAVGAATVDAGETTVTGTGTVWSSLQPGDLFGVHIGLAVPIAEVVSDTEFTLLFPWPGAAQTDADYCVQFVPRSVGVQEATRQLLLMLANGNLDAFAALMGGADKIPMFTGPGTLTVVNKSELVSGVQADKQVADLAARAAYDNSPIDFKVLVSNTGDGRAALYTKLSNATADWSDAAYITGPVGSDGVNPRGFYDNGTAYFVDDLVYSGGSTWIAKIPTTGNAPPTLPTTENTQWRLFARAGAAMNPRGDYAAGTAYEPLDTVLSGGSSWVAKIPTTGNPPPTFPITSNAQWQLLAQKGTDGTGTGDVVGPSSATDSSVAGFDSTTGKLLKVLSALQVRTAARVQSSSLRNKLRNPLFSINQRKVSGTVNLAAGAFGHDRMRAGANGCTYTFATTNGVTTINISAGSLQQPVQASDFAGEAGTYFLSWSGTAQGRINGGSYGLTGEVSAVCDGSANVVVEFNVGTVSLVQLERDYVTDFLGARQNEMTLCREFYQRMGGEAQFDIFLQSLASTSIAFGGTFTIIPMRTAPTATKMGTWGVFGSAQPQVIVSSRNTFSMNASGTNASASQAQFYTTGGTTYVDLNAEILS